MFNHHSLIPWGSLRGRQEEKWGSVRGRDQFGVGDHFVVGIISGAVQVSFSSSVSHARERERQPEKKKEIARTARANQLCVGLTTFFVPFPSRALSHARV